MSFVVTAAAINWLLQYLFSLEYHLSRYPAAEVWGGHAASVALLSLFVVGTAAAWSRRPIRPPSASACLMGLDIWCVLALYAFVVVQRSPRFGWRPLDLTNSRYLADWEWVNFTGVLAPACATLGSAIAWLRIRRLRRLA